MTKKIRILYTAYAELIGEIYRQAPFMVVFTFIAAVVSGLVTPLSVFVNSHIFNDALAVARGNMTFSQYTPYLALFVILAIAPPLISNIFIFGYVESKSQLILRTALKGRMLQKIKKMRYEHFESESSVEIIDKAYNRAEKSARHMFPLYLTTTLTSIIACIGSLWYLATVRWWIVLIVIAPVILEKIWLSKHNDNIYDELESFWNKERRYGILGGYFINREHMKENKINSASDYLIDTYKERLNSRNKEYERFYFKHLKQYFAMNNLTGITPVVNILILLQMFVNKQLDVGLFISFSVLMFSINGTLSRCTLLFTSSGYHINFFDYYNKYFALSENEQSNDNKTPERVKIEFRDVWFRYPGTEKDILKGLSFVVREGEKVSLVGENGEGKSTMVKLLLGLFRPDRGDIYINGKPLFSYSDKARGSIFGAVFQDFVRYSISAKENVELGNIDAANEETFGEAVKKAHADKFISELPDGANTLLGRDFDGGVDLSGGQWQRIAIARAFMGDKPALILDEPTSQLDPIAESNLYGEFAEMAAGRTAIFITHRMASTMITDRIFVISGGKITENGSHTELIRQGGLYAAMFEAQKQWYVFDHETNVNK